MNLFFITADKYKAELLAKNYTQAMIDEIETLKKDLNDANTAQEKFKKTKGVKLQDRIKLLNAAWAIDREVSHVGKLIYKKQDNFAKYIRYLLPPSEQSEFPKEGVNAGGQTINIIKGPFPPVKKFKLKNTGTTPQTFCLAATAADACGTGVNIAPGTEETHPASDLGTGTFLNVTNNGAVQGSWELDEA